MSSPFGGQDCDQFACPCVDVSFPLVVSPDVRLRAIRAEALGQPSVSCASCGCCGCEVVVTQQVRLTFSVRFGVCAAAGGEVECAPCGSPPCQNCRDGTI